jgi:hypothetical protein
MLLPWAQPGRLTTSCTTLVRSGVWTTAPIVVHAAGAKPTDAVVRAREATLLTVVAKTGASSMACARIVNDVADEPVSSTVKATYARVTTAPFGTATPRKRMPTFWLP